MEEISPKNGKWVRTKTSDWLADHGMKLFGVDATRTRHPTQTSSTLTTYMKYYDMIKERNPKSWQTLRVLDASSGLGHGTQYGRNNGFYVTDIDPYPSADYSDGQVRPREVGKTNTGRPIYAYNTDFGLPEYYGPDAYNRLISDGRQFDVILSNAVLNILPQDLRDEHVLILKRLLAPGGEIYIHTRSDRDIKTMHYEKMDWNVQLSDDGTEWFLGKTGAYQKGFSVNELIGYLEDALGEDYSISKATGASMTTTVRVYYNPERW